MPGMPPSINSEREGLLAYLRQQRDGLKHAAYGLSEEQIRMRPTRSALTIGGLLKHVAGTERGWVDTLLQRHHEHGGGEEAYGDEFRLGPDDTLESLIADLDRTAAETEAVVNGLPDLEGKVPLPPAPWFPQEPEGFSARWILLHLVEEHARHAGHADIIREQIDGATMYELMAGAEGWPETEWLKPFVPATGRAATGTGGG